MIRYVVMLRPFATQLLYGRRIFFFVLLPLVVLSGSALHAQPTGPTQKIQLIHADSLRSNRLQGAEVVELLGNVELRQGLTTITSTRAIYYSSGDRAILSGNVRIVQPGTVLTAPEVDYNGAADLTTAPVGVTIQEDGGTLNAGYGEYSMSRRISYFRNNVTLRDSNIVLTAAGGTYSSIERKAFFEGNVVAKSDSGELTADQLTYWRDSEQSFAVGNVRLFSLSDSSLLTCDTLRHRPKVETWAFGHVTLDSKKDSSLLSCDTLQHRPGIETFALGNVSLTSRKESAVLTGDSLRHRPKEDYTIITGEPKLIRIDSTLRLLPESDGAAEGNDSGAVSPPDSLAVQLDTIQRGDSLFTVRRDTTTITARKLERFTQDRKEIAATGSAHITRGTLESVAEIARFFEDDEIVALGPGRRMRGGVGSAGDSVASEKESVVDEANPPSPDDEGLPEPVAGDSIPRYSSPVVWYEESQLTGDTITIFLEEKKLRTIDVVGNAFTISKGDAPERYDQLASERLIFNILQDTIRSVRANGAAASIYFLYDHKAPNGLNRSSGDTIVIGFADGKASRVGIYGPRTRLEGEVIPEKDVAGRETVYRLSGFNRYERESLRGMESPAGSEGHKEEEGGSGSLPEE